MHASPPLRALRRHAPTRTARRLQSTHSRVRVASAASEANANDANTSIRRPPNAALFERSSSSMRASDSNGVNDGDAASRQWPPNAALFEPSSHSVVEDEGERAPPKRHHRPSKYMALGIKTSEHDEWTDNMERPKFRALLEDCMATNAVSLPLRHYLDEFPLLGYGWSDQELVLLVGALIKSNRVPTALALLKNQLAPSADRNRLNRLNRVAAESARLGNAAVAVGILRIARHVGIEPDVVTYTSAIHACARASRDRIARAFQLLEEMVDAGVTPNERTYGAVVLAYARLNRWDEIEEFLESLPYDAELSKSDVFAAAIITCSRNRQFVVATKLFAMLVDEGVYPGEKVGNAALSACARTSDIEQITKIMAFLETQSKPSIYSYNTMITAYGNACRMDDALAVYERILAQSIAPDAITFNALILAARRSRQPGLLPSILAKRAARGIQWDVYTLNGLLESCQLTGDVALAERYWNQATEEQKLRRDRTNYETLMGVYYDAGEYQKVIDLWREDVMCRRRAKSAKTLNFLLRACSKLGDVTSATTILEEFVKRGQIPTAITHNHLLSTHLKADDWSGAQQQLEKMASESSLATVFGFTAMMKHAMKDQRFDDALDIFDEFEATQEKYANEWSPQLLFPPEGVYMLAARAAKHLNDHARLVSIYQALKFGMMSVTVKTELARLVIASCEEKEDWRCAVSLYDELSKNVDDDTNVEFYEIVVKIVARAGEFERALDVNGGDWYRQNRPDQGWF